MELLVVLVILGILLAITVNAVLGARDKAKQAATMADMRNLAVAIAAYTLDYNFPPPATGDFVEVASLLEPYHYNSAVPENDHWRHLYDFFSEGSDYSLISYGKDGVDGIDLTWESRFEYERDIVLVNGEFRYMAESLEDGSDGPNGNNGHQYGKDHGKGKPEGVP